MLMASNGHFYNSEVRFIELFMAITGTHLDADTTTDAELFGQYCYLGVWSYFNAELSHSNDGTRALALLPASLRLAFVSADDSNTRLLIRLISLAISRHSVILLK